MAYDRTESNGSRPNILFILTDDQRHDTIHALGNPYIRTPTMDGLVQRGTAFSHAFIPGGTCMAVCMPSRAMIHTGRKLFSFPGHGESIPEELVLMGEHLAAGGYQSYGIGKWHNGPRSFARSFGGGSEIFFGGMWDHWNVPAYSYRPDGDYTNRVPYVTDAFHSKDVTWQLSDHVRPGVHSTELFAEAAIDWLGSRNDDRPFFLSVAFMAPHDPRTMPKRFRDLYRDSDLPAEPAFASEYQHDYGVANIRDEGLAAYPRTQKEAAIHLADYYAMITHLDDAIGRILNRLDSLGQLEQTIIVLAGDNGLALSNHGLYGKQSCFDHSVRVPLLFAGPGVERGKVSGVPCYLLDIFPTICELTGLSVPTTVEGRSLASVLGGKPKMWGESEVVYLAYGDVVRGVRTATYKLIEYAASGTRTTLLFDLQHDPHELHNLAGDESKRELVRELRRRMVQQRDQWNDDDHPTGHTFWEKIGETWK